MSNEIDKSVRQLSNCILSYKEAWLSELLEPLVPLEMIVLGRSKVPADRQQAAEYLKTHGFEIREQPSKGRTELWHFNECLGIFEVEFD